MNARKFDIIHDFNIMQTCSNNHTSENNLNMFQSKKKKKVLCPLHDIYVVQDLGLRKDDGYRM